jgi:thioredoxin-like negative regulator of GroEL
MITCRRLFLCAAAFALTCVSASAAERHPYESAAFRAALETGKPILVHITAVWCGECRQQKPIVAALTAQSEYDALTSFDVDFDTQKDALRELRVPKQSTLVVYKNRAEVTRAVGITRRDAIEAVLKNAL